MIDYLEKGLEEGKDNSDNDKKNLWTIYRGPVHIPCGWNDYFLEFTFSTTKFHPELLYICRDCLYSDEFSAVIRSDDAEYHEQPLDWHAVCTTTGTTDQHEPLDWSLYEQLDQMLEYSSMGGRPQIFLLANNNVGDAKIQHLRNVYEDQLTTMMAQAEEEDLQKQEKVILCLFRLDDGYLPADYHRTFPKLALSIMVKEGEMDGRRM